MAQIKDTNWITKYNYVVDAPDWKWLEQEADHVARKTPLATMFGFQTSEEAYDKLTFNEQIIVDLTAEGYNQSQIAWTLGISQPTVSITYRRIAYRLADSKLKISLDARKEMKEWYGSKQL